MVRQKEVNFMLATNLQYNSQERYIFEEVYINGKIELIKINKEDYQTNTEHKQIIIEMNEGIQDSEQAQELKSELEKKLNATIKVIKHTADEQNAEAHYHFQILSNEEINNQSIYKVANDFIKAIKGAEMTQVRIYDNSKKREFSLTEKEQAELKKVKEENFSFIKKNSKTHEVNEIENYKIEGNKNPTGMGTYDRPYFIINGIFDAKEPKLVSRFGIGMFKSEKLEITEDTVKQSIKKFFEEINEDNTFQELGDNWDKFLNIEIEESEDELSINFNNLIVLKNGNVASTAKNLIEEHLKSIVKNAIFNEQLIIENDDRLKPKEKVLAELQYLSGQEHTSEVKQEEQEQDKLIIETVQEEADKSQATTDFYLDFMVEIKTIKTFKELEAKKAELEAEAEKVEAVRGILAVEMINEKLEQIADKKELLSIVKVERTAEQALKEDLEATKKSLAAQTQTSEDLTAELIKTTGELEATKASYKSLDEAHDRMLKEHSEDLDNWEAERDEFKMEIGGLEDTNKELEEQAVQYRTEIKDTKQSLATEKATTKKLNEELSERTHELREATAKLETATNLIEEQETSINDLTTQNEQQSKAYIILETKQVNTLEELKAEKVEVKKYNKLYSDTVSKLEKTEENLKAVNQKLADKENKNKGLVAEIKDFVEEVFNLKGSNSNLTAQKVALEQEKAQLNTNIQDIGEELTSALNEVKTTKQDLENGKEEAKKYVEDLEATHEEQKQEATNYVNGLLARIKDLEEQPQGQGQGKKPKPE